MATPSSPETQLAQSYDELVESRNFTLSFTHEAAMVARFIRLYVQNLFDLSEPEFKNVMKKHGELHAKASSCERQGKNPNHLLKRQILKQDRLGRILARYSAHLGALDCILDVRATAALVHHMICLQTAADLPLMVSGCEFGAGTGILSVAGTIPFVHKGKFLTVNAFELAGAPLEDARKIVEILQEESRYKDLIQIHMHAGDVTTEGPYLAVTDTEGERGPLALWISETFGYRSKKPVISEGICSFDYPTTVVPYPPELEEKYDPLPRVLDQSCRHFESFLHNIRTGRILAFPDIVTPKVIIDGLNSAILSPDGTWRNLHRIGQPYDMLPSCVPSRWYYQEKPKSPKKGGLFQIKKKKK